MIIILCVQITLPSNLLHDIISVPLLFSHFHHHNLDDEITFIDFVINHYQGEDSHHDQDHNQLPFHHHHNQITDSAQPMIAYLGNNQYAFSPLFFQIFQLKSSFRQEFYPSDCSSSVWRPPKSA